MPKNITYATHPDGYVISRVGSEVAWPVIQYDQIGKDGDFSGPMPVQLEKFSVSSLNSVTGYFEWATLTWTKKIPTEIKNNHRQFWGMNPLKDRS
jgi:hypothetical protein